MTISQNQGSEPSQEEFLTKKIAERKKTAQNDREKAKTWAKYHKELKKSGDKNKYYKEFSNDNFEVLETKNGQNLNSHGIQKTRRQRNQRSKNRNMTPREPILNQNNSIPEYYIDGDAELDQLLHTQGSKSVQETRSEGSKSEFHNIYFKNSVDLNSEVVFSEKNVIMKKHKKSRDSMVPINIDLDNKGQMWDAAFSKFSVDNRAKISQLAATPSVSDLSPRPSENRGQQLSNMNLSKLSHFTNNQLLKSQQKKIDS